VFVCFIFLLYIFNCWSHISWPRPHTRRLAGLAGIIITKRKWIHFGLHFRIHLFHLHTMFTVRFVLSRQTSNLIIQLLALADIELFNGCPGASAVTAVRASDLIKRSRVRLPACAQSITWINSTFHPSWVGKSTTSLYRLELRRGVFACIGWQVTPCDLIRHATPRSSEMGFPMKNLSGFNF